MRSHPLDSHVTVLTRLAERLGRCPVTVRRADWGGWRYLVFTMHGPRVRTGQSPDYDVTLALVRHCLDQGLSPQCVAERVPADAHAQRARPVVRARRGRSPRRPVHGRGTSRTSRRP